MLHILLLILKIVGVILAVILGILLLVICIILFVPFCYQGAAKWDAGKKDFKAQGRVTWLLGLLEIRFAFKDGRSSVRGRIAWKKLGSFRTDSQEEEPALSRAPEPERVRMKFDRRRRKSMEKNMKKNMKKIRRRLRQLKKRQQHLRQLRRQLKLLVKRMKKLMRGAKKHGPAMKRSTIRSAKRLKKYTGGFSRSFKR